MLNHADIIETLPCDIQNKETVTMTTYQLGNTGTIKLLNYKENLWMWIFLILWSTSQAYKIWRRGYNW